MKNLNNHGFSLIETLIAAALIGTAVIAMSTLYQTLFRGTGLAESRAKTTEITHSLLLHLADQLDCDTNFKSKTLSQNGQLGFSKMIDSNNTVLLSLNKRIDGSQLSPSAISLEVPDDVWAAYQTAKASPLPTRGYLVNSFLQITLDRPSTTMSAKSTTVSLNVPMFLDDNNTILSCYTLGSELDTLALATICAQLGGTVDTTSGICQFSPNCDSLDPTKPVDGACILNKVAALKTSIQDLSADIAALDSTQSRKTFQEKMYDCLRSPTTVIIGKDSVTCSTNSATTASGYKFVATPTTFDTSQGTSGIKANTEITNPTDAQYLYDTTKGFLAELIPKVVQ